MGEARSDRIEWYDIFYKDKYSGEVYLELTFFSNVRTSPVPRRLAPDT
jgi:hypothetical protein